MFSIVDGLLSIPTNVLIIYREYPINKPYEGNPHGGDTMAIEVLAEGMENTEMVSTCCSGGGSARN
jgi:hypothetical protein